MEVDQGYSDHAYKRVDTTATGARRGGAGTAGSAPDMSTGSCLQFSHRFLNEHEQNNEK
jgi:hypothetical protein